MTIAINTPSVALHANFGFRRTRVAILSHDQAASAPACSGFVKRCERPDASQAMPLRLDPAGFFAWSFQTIPSVSHPVPGNWVAKSVAKTGAFWPPAYGKKKCNREFATAWTEWRYFAVQVEIVEGRQSDQSCRHTAVHADIEAAIV